MPESCEHRDARPLTRGRHYETDIIPPPSLRYCPDCETWLPPGELQALADDPPPYRPVSIGPIPADHPLLDTGPIVDLVATYGPDAGRPVPEAGLYAGLMTNDWLLRLAYPDGEPGGAPDA